jgi:hypothetical protein
MDEGFVLPVKPIDTSDSAYPQVSCFVFKYIIDRTTAYAGRIFRVVAVNDYLIAIISIQAIPCA